MQKPAALFLSKNQQVFGNTASLLQIKVNKGRQALPYSPKAAEKASLTVYNSGSASKECECAPSPPRNKEPAAILKAPMQAHFLHTNHGSPTRAFESLRDT